MLDSILGKEPSVAEILAMLDATYLPPGAPRTRALPTPAAKSATPELAKRPAPINPPRTTRPGQSPRPPMPAQPRRTPPKKRSLTEADGQRVVKRLQEMLAILARPATPAPAAAIERPGAGVYLSKMERIVAGEGVHTSALDTDDGVLSKRMSREPLTLLDRFAPRSFS